MDKINLFLMLLFFTIMTIPASAQSVNNDNTQLSDDSFSDSIADEDAVGSVDIVNELLYASHQDITNAMINHSKNNYSVANELIFTMTYVDEQTNQLVIVLDPILLGLRLFHDAGDIEDILGTEDVDIKVSYGALTPQSHVGLPRQSQTDSWIALYNSRCSPPVDELCQALVFNLGTKNHYTLDSNNLWHPPTNTTALGSAPATQTATNPGATNPPNVFFSDTFRTLDNWTISGESDWRSDIFDEHALPTPDHSNFNKVAEADDCDTFCAITTTESLDISNLDSPVLEFWRFVDNSVDGYGTGTGEYLRVEVSTNGTSWIQLDLWTEESGDDDGSWHAESYDLTPYKSSNFQIRFTASASSENEDVGIDDVQILTTSAVSPLPAIPNDNTPPVIDIPDDIAVQEQSPSQGALVYIRVTAIDSTDGPVHVACDRQTGWFAAGVHTATCSASDDAGNTSSESFTIAVESSAPERALRQLFTQQDVRGGMPILSHGLPPFFDYESLGFLVYLTGTLSIILDDGDGNKNALTASHVVSPWSSFLSINKDRGHAQIGHPEIGTQVIADTNVNIPGATTDSDAVLVRVSGDGIRPFVNQIQAGDSILDVISFGGLSDMQYPTVEKSARHGVSSGGVVNYQNVTVSLSATTPALSYTLTNQAVALYLDSRKGDSGGPIYINHGNGTATYLGVMGGTTCVFTLESGYTVDVTYIDDYGDHICRSSLPYGNMHTVFSPWENIVADLGVEHTGTGVITDTPITSFTDDFQGTLSSWSLDGDGDWETAAPHMAMSGQQAGNKILTSNDCDSECIISVTSKLNTLSSLTIEFDRFIDSAVDGDEGLYVQYSTDGTNWITLASYTNGNNQNTNRWEDATLTLDITQNSASLRFLAESSLSSEIVEVDNVSIFLTPATDTVVPTITAPTDKTIEATGASTPLTATQIGTAIATDDEDSNPAITSDAPSSFNVGTTIITWTATDSSGNSATATQRVMIQDTTPPDTNAPPDASFTAAGTTISLTQDDYGTATATDLVDPSPTITSNATTSFDAGRTTTITWTAEDRYHNSATDTQLITVILSSLNITAPPDVTVEATGSTMVIDIGTANATHDTDTDLTISNDAPESFPVGVTTTVTWKVVDSSSVTAMANQLVTVQDTTPPTFGEAPQDLSFVFDPDVPLIVNYDSPMATDIVDDSVGISCLPASGTAFGEGATTVTCTATDDYSNSADVTFDVNVRVYDTTVFSDGFEGRVHDSWDSPQFSFWSTGYNVPVTVPGHGSSNKIAHAAGCDFAGGCVMELTDGLDLSNHTDTEFLKFYRYLDTRLDPGDYLKLEAYDGSAWAELGRWNPENSDDDGAWHLEEYDLANYTDSSGFKLRFTAVAGAGIDEFGVDDVLVYKVPEVASNGTALAITAPADVVAEATGTLTAVDIGTATATGGFGNVTISHEPQAPFPLGNTTVTWTALDSNGTSATDTQLVTVQDTTAPTVASITRSNPAGGVTNNTSLIFAVTFSEDVTGVDVSDFALSPNSTGGGASATGQFAQTSEPAFPIPDRSTIRDAITVGQSGNATSVSVAVDVTHTYIGDLKIDIIAPDGTTRTLHDRTGYETDDIDQTYAPDFAGVSIAGDWTLRVRDGAGGDTGTLNGWTLTIGQGGAGSPVTGLTGSGSVYYATVSAAQDGTYNLDLVPSGHGIADAADSPLTDPNPTGADHTYTRTSP